MVQLIPQSIKKAQEDYGIVLSEDEAICVMRNFKWDAERMSYSWFDEQDVLKKKLGLEFDKSLMKKPETRETISTSLAENNGNTCIVCYGDFKEAIQKGKKEEMPLSLVCGH